MYLILMFFELLTSAIPYKSMYNIDQCIEKRDLQNVKKCMVSSSQFEKSAQHNG
jgi:hypothetical protein